MTARGAASSGLSAAILKLASRCNINCSYCYMYHLADRSFSLQPRVMSDQTVRAVVDWVERYLTETDTPDFHLSIHGGEPLLAGTGAVRLLAECTRAASARCKKDISIGLTTNALLLDEEWVALFDDHQIKFGTSLDGPADYHDRFRRTHAGGGTHDDVERKIRWVMQHERGRHLFSGVLCVLHPEMDGSRLVDYFFNLGLSSIDLLLPDQNHAHGSECYPPPDATMAYGRLLVDAYRSWRALDDPSFRIRKFALLMGAILGDTPTLDSLGTGPITVFTVETDGMVEPVDTMKLCGEGSTKTGLFIHSATTDEVHAQPLIAIGLRKRETLPAVCLNCRHVSLCGGGYLPHRFTAPNSLSRTARRDEMFSRETVYCRDMMYLCDVIRADVKAEVQAARGAAAGSP